MSLFGAGGRANSGGWFVAFCLFVFCLNQIFAADFPFYPKSRSDSNPAAEQVAHYPVKSPKAVKRKEGDSSGGSAASGYLQREARAKAMGFDMEAGRDSKDLEFMGPFGQILFGPLPIASIELEMDEDEAVLLFYKAAHDNSSFPASLVQDGQKLKGRVSVKGSSTRGFIKKSLLFKLDKESIGNWNGYRKISLNSMASDPSMVREWLSWDLARAAGMNVLNTFYTRLYINKKYVGLFFFTEWVTPEVFDRAGLGTDGELYQPNDAGHCGDLSAESLEHKSKRGADCYEKFSPPDNDFSELKRLTQGVSSTPETSFYRFVDTNFHDDSLLNWIAVNGLISNGDSYNKNYFLYYSHKVNQWAVMPWDYDLSFGRSWDPYLGKPKDVFNDNFVYYYSPEIGFPGLAKIKTLEDPVLMARFKSRLGHLLGIGKPSGHPATYGWFSPERVAARINVIQNYTMQDAQQDTFSTNRVYSYEEQMEAMKYFALAHYSYLRETTVGEGTNWTYTYDPNQPMIPPPTQPGSLNASWTAQQPSYDRPLVDQVSGRIAAVVKVKSISKPTMIAVNVLSFQAPKMLPPERSNDQCVQRQWDLSTQGSASVIADVTFEYLQENSHNSEVRNLAGQQQDLQLWQFDGEAWSPQFTRTNSLSKTLTVRNLSLPRNRTYTFVACVDSPDVPVEQDSGATSTRDVKVPNQTVKDIKGFLDRLKK